MTSLVMPGHVDGIPGQPAQVSSVCGNRGNWLAQLGVSGSNTLMDPQLSYRPGQPSVR